MNAVASAPNAALLMPPYGLAPDVLLVSVPDGSARLIDLHGKFFALSETAAAMLQDTLALGPERAAAHVAARWGIGCDQAVTDLSAFVAELSRQGLLVPADRQRRRSGLRGRLATAFVSGLVRLTRRIRPSLKGKVSGLLTMANLSCRWLGWANTVALWQRLFVPQQLLQGAAAEPVRNELDAAVRQAIQDSAFAHACKERGLVSWALGRCSGLDVRLVIGLSLCPVHGHCWARVGDFILGDDDDQCGQYEPMQCYT